MDMKVQVKIKIDNKFVAQYIPTIQRSKNDAMFTYYRERNPRRSYPKFRSFSSSLQVHFLYFQFDFVEHIADIENKKQWN